MNMSYAAIATQIFLVLALTYLAYTLLFLFLRPKQKDNIDKKKPPGPKPLPIIGNLHILGTLPHRTLQSLAKKHGPIMSLQLGQVPTVVVSSSDAAQLFLKTHDVVFASRPKIQASQIMSYGSKGMAFSEYGPYWRSTRRLCTTQLLTMSKVELFAPVRREALCGVVKSLQKVAVVGEVVNLSEVVERLTEDTVYKMILGRGRKYNQFDLKSLVQEAVRLVGAFNLADYVPCLRAFDLQGLTRGCKRTGKAIDEALEQIIEEHEQGPNEGKGDCRDFVDILLSEMHQTKDLQAEHDIVMDRTNIKAIVLDMIVGSIETSATTVEWALSLLLKHPRVMKVLQDEIENEVGLGRMVEEKDLMKLSYLDMVVDETLRLYPVAPLLLPRECRESITIEGYYIEEKSRVIVNAWAIGRDPNVWSDNAETFYPERFMDRKINHQGDFGFIPFGYGRRGCPGIQLGLVMVKLIVAQLVHCFSWELPPNVSAANLNMQEKFGLSIPRTEQLLAIPTYRLDRNV